MRHFDEDDRERMEIEADRVERIRDYVPSEEFDETTAIILARQQPGTVRYKDDGK